MTHKLAKAVGWSALDAFIRYGLNFLVLLTLARMLSPSDFGLVAMLGLFVAVSKVLVEGGFGQALIQRQQTTLSDESTIFFFTVVMGAMVAVVLCGFAPWIADFYAQPLLKPLTYWMALDIFLNSFGIVHTALLTKQLDFKTITKTGIFSSLFSGLLAVFLAFNGGGGLESGGANFNNNSHFSDIALGYASMEASVDLQPHFPEIVFQFWGLSATGNNP